MRLRVGLTGGIGAGKSVVAAILAERGALVIDADELARLAVAPGSAAFERIRDRWPSVAAPDGTLDRAALAAIVFADPQARAALNAIVHPAVRALGAERETLAGPDRIVVHDVPLLFESGFAALCDATVVVTAPLPLRVARVVARSGWTAADVEARIAAQIDPERAAGLADYVIRNDGSEDALRAAVEDVYRALADRPPRVAARATP